MIDQVLERRESLMEQYKLRRKTAHEDDDLKKNK
jgi:hypothetical protein